MSYDMDMCEAMTHDNGYCPLRDKCKRFILGHKALMEDYYPIYWIEPCYEDGKCELFIEVKEEKEMKKRIRKTGEIVDVISYNKYTNTARNSELDWVSYIDSKGMEHEHEKGLNIYWDFEDVVEVPNTDIDWEKVRIKAAISALQGFASNPNITSVTDEELAKWSVSCADDLIAELKKGGEK